MVTPTKPASRGSTALSVWSVLAVLFCALLFAQPLGPGTRIGALPVAPATEEKALDTDAYTRETVSFRCSGETCAAWLYLPKQPINSNPPVVVMGNGMGLGRTSGLHAPAEALAQAGFAVFAFDYRTFGASSGLPRQTVSTTRMREDYRSAITYVKSHLSERVNATNISLWGFSLSGAVVTRLAVDVGTDVTAVVAVAGGLPTPDVLLAVIRMRPLGFIRLMFAAVQDTLRTWLHLPPLYTPISGAPTSSAMMMSTPKEVQQYEAMIPAGDHQVRWWNLWRPSYVFEMFRDSHAAVNGLTRVKAPLLMQTFTYDTWIPAFMIKRVAARAPDIITYQEYPGDHFDVAAPAPLEAQVAFLRKHAM